MSQTVEWVNVLSCLVLLETLFRVVSAMPRHSAWPQRLALAWMAVVVGAQASLSFAPDTAPVSWQTALLLSSAAACVLVWRGTILRALHAAYPVDPPRRRKTDFAWLDEAQRG